MLDEFATWWITRGSLKDALFNTSPFNPHLVFYGLVWAITTVCGDGVLALRLLSYLSFVLFVSLAYLFLNKRYGLGALQVCAILAFFPPEFPPLLARPYMLGLVFCLAAWIFASRELRLLNFAGAFICCCLAFLTHQSFVSAFYCPLALWVFSSHIQRARKFTALCSFCCASGLFILLTRVLLPSVVTLHDTKIQFYFTHSTWSFLVASLDSGGILWQIAYITLALILLQRLTGQRHLVAQALRATDVRAGGMVVALAVLTPMLLSEFAGASLLISRYILTASIGVLGILGCIFGLSSRRAAVVAVLTISALINCSLVDSAMFSSNVNVVAATASVELTRGSKRLIIVETAHAQAFFREWNQTPRLSSAWTSPVAYYERSDEHATIVPLVEQPLQSESSTLYELPWGSFDLRETDIVELHQSFYGFPPARIATIALEDKLAQLSFQAISYHEDLENRKTIFARVPPAALDN
jgi:hypothetical protein